MMEMWGNLNKAQSEPCIVVFNLYGEMEQIATHPEGNSNASY